MRCHLWFQPAPKYHTKGCSHLSVDSPGARTLVFVAFEPCLAAAFRASIAQTPFCAILWRSAIVGASAHGEVVLITAFFAGKSRKKFAFRQILVTMPDTFAGLELCAYQTYHCRHTLPTSKKPLQLILFNLVPDHSQDRLQAREFGDSLLLSVWHGLTCFGDVFNNFSPPIIRPIFGRINLVLSDPTFDYSFLETSLFFKKLRITRTIPQSCLSFPGDFESAKSIKNSEKHSQGIIFAITS